MPRRLNTDPGTSAHVLLPSAVREPRMTGTCNQSSPHQGHKQVEGRSWRWRTRTKVAYGDVHKLPMAWGCGLCGRLPNCQCLPTKFLTEHASSESNLSSGTPGDQTTGPLALACARAWFAQCPACTGSGQRRWRGHGRGGLKRTNSSQTVTSVVSCLTFPAATHAGLC